MSKINWGILGAGNISSSFVHDLVLNNSRNEKITHIVRSIGTSSIPKGEEFVKQNVKSISDNDGVTPQVQVYNDFFQNKDIDVVYIGTPHPFHKKQALQAIENGLHVLCEKPVTVTEDSAKELIEAAKKKGVFFMEAVWTRFFPSVQLLKKLIFEEKALGDIKRLMMDFAFDADLENVPATSRIRDKNLAGGALLDIGVYNLTYSRILLDDKLGKEAEPFEVKSFQTIDPTDGVDYVSSFLLKYKNGKHAILTCSNWSDVDGPYLTLEGTKAKLQMWSPNPACPKKLKVTFKDKSKQPIEYEDTSGYNGFIYEANAVAEDIFKGNLQNETMPWDETLLVMRVMDNIRKEGGLVYPDIE
ncbi:putative D-xylose 1-dehydrogenase (NADP(+)) [[Candida] railenensis]|uniref:D-xylose 1-dehydrogenase (NADP(+), D-xylono-1,5-lactone-forming) n=1 Tax=[Candida] railenensis TaxID=45579 RepID=A0A9P0QLD6_9ASCO|nr:putative D-xylose 1-dehydrogenase (NADP(+)) [[Candida] railenensis]